MQRFDKTKCMRSHVVDEDRFNDHVSIVLNLKIKCRIWCLHVSYL